MAIFANASRTIVIRAHRETVGLIVAASALTFALASAIHSRQPPAPSAPTAVQRQPQDWTGHLADVAPRTETVPAEPLSSAALVVPKSQLALPTTPASPLVRSRNCVDTSCATKANGRVPLARRQIAAAVSAATEKSDRAPTEKKSALAALNPLNHLPDMSAIGRPFTYAGGTISGWIKRF